MKKKVTLNLHETEIRGLKWLPGAAPQYRDRSLSFMVGDLIRRRVNEAELRVRPQKQGERRAEA